MVAKYVTIFDVTIAIEYRFQLLCKVLVFGEFATSECMQLNFTKTRGSKGKLK